MRAVRQPEMGRRAGLRAGRAPVPVPARLRLAVLAMLAALPPAAAAFAAEAESIGEHQCTVYNAQGAHVVVLFHGYLRRAKDYYPLALDFAHAGYAVVVPRDCDGVTALACAATWGKDVAAAARDWAAGRRVAVVGHSMGGGAAMAAAKFTPGIDAYIAMHPAPIVSGVSWAKVRGPTLFTTGTDDTGTIGGKTLGATSPQAALNAYNDADPPKALVNVKGDPHWSSANLQGEERRAVMSWLSCFLKRDTTSCEWLRREMCNSNSLEWCANFGLQHAVWNMAGVHI